MGRFLRPALGFAGVVGLVGVLGALWFFAFSLGDLFIPVVAPLTAIGIGYLCAVADRSLVEQLEKLRARSTLSKYLTPAIVDEMLRSPTESLLGGNRSEITILFSDIRGFTTTSEQLTPEQVVELLNEYLTIMTEVVFKYEGTVDKFEGDAILAFFGAPKKHDDDPDRAVQTAIEMRDKLADFQERWQLTANTPIRIGVGINTGQAVVGNIGSERRMDYTIIGDAVNLASRIQDLTKEHGVSILISENTRTALKQPYQLNFVGTTAIRGREQSVGLYEVVGNDLALVGVN